jgi:hypothetical protein
MEKILFFFGITIFSQDLLFAQNIQIKKSAKSGICYGEVSKSYKRFGDFSPFETMDEYITARGKIQKVAVKKNSLIKI